MAKHNTCTYCGKLIILVPSAEERAKKSDKTAKFYRGLFTAHAECQVAAHYTTAKKKK